MFLDPAIVSMKRPHHHRTAFTVAELALVLAVMALFAGIAVPRFAGFLAQRRLEAATRRVQTDLELARRQAKLTGSSRTVAFDTTTDTYTLAGVTDPDRPDQAYVVNLSHHPYQATIVSADFGGTSTATFDGYGATLFGGTIVIGIGARTVTITLEGPIPGGGEIIRMMPQFQ